LRHDPDEAQQGGRDMSRIAFVAEIRPGRKADLERILAEGPPFDLAGAGFERHRVFVGDHDAVFLFEGVNPLKAVQALATQRSLTVQISKMMGILAAPRFLGEAYAWDRPAAAPTPE
jgi:hypothetical protein